jgi:hypothetical protein
MQDSVQSLDKMFIQLKDEARRSTHAMVGLPWHAQPHEVALLLRVLGAFDARLLATALSPYCQRPSTLRVPKVVVHTTPARLAAQEWASQSSWPQPANSQ